MPDERQHRGPHPEDEQLFATSQVTRLQTATAELSWLLTRGYGGASSLKLVGDRHALDARQRTAVGRCAVGDEARERRRGQELTWEALRGRELWIDAYNVLTSVEAALAGGVLLVARDGCYRDMASLHGSFRQVVEKLPAIELVGEVLERGGAGEVTWFLDQPVSNSGRLAALLRETGERRRWSWRAELVADPDKVLISASVVVASADSRILDGTRCWVNLSRRVIDERVRGAWMVDLSGRERAESISQVASAGGLRRGESGGAAR